MPPPPDPTGRRLPDHDDPTGTVTRAAVRAAWAPLLALTFINLFNYVDRFVVTALLPSIQAELHLTDSQGGLLGTAFIVVYFISCPLFGWLGDRGPRKPWLALGVALWSVATATAGLARNFFGLFAARAAVGIGEAAYGTIAPSLIADYFPRAIRGRYMSIFYLAIPVGSALGYLLGGLCGELWGWRAAFGIVGLPGLALALAMLLMREPQRGQYDRPAISPASTLPSPRGAYRALAQNRLYVWTVAGYTAYTFALGGLAFWMPSYMLRVRGYSPGEGMLMFGGITVVTGFVGTLAGGWLGDFLLRYTRKAYTWLSVVAMLGGALATFAALLADDPAIFLVCLVVAQLCLFLNTGPINALLVDIVAPSGRATAVAMSNFCIHLLGDAISPTLIGSVSDHTDLATGMLAIPAFFLIAGALWASTLPTRAAR